MGAASELKAEAEKIADEALGIKPSIIELLAAVKADIGAVGKTGTNKQQGYNFRGVDAVVNAVGPAFTRHGVVVMPGVRSIEFETYSTKNGTLMRSCVVKTRYRFYGPAGDYLDAEVYGESSDAGDKSTPKAQSVAYRVALLQALTIPTDEPDPDETSHERSATPEVLLPEGWRTEAERKEAFDELREAKKALTGDALAEVEAWVSKHGMNYGTFTKAMADELRNLLPAAPLLPVEEEK